MDQVSGEVILRNITLCKISISVILNPTTDSALRQILLKVGYMPGEVNAGTKG